MNVFLHFELNVTVVCEVAKHRVEEYGVTYVGYLLSPTGRRVIADLAEKDISLVYLRSPLRKLTSLASEGRNKCMCVFALCVEILALCRHAFCSIVCESVSRVALLC